MQAQTHAHSKPRYMVTVAPVSTGSQEEGGGSAGIQGRCGSWLWEPGALLLSPLCMASLGLYSQGTPTEFTSLTRSPLPPQGGELQDVSASPGKGV